MGCIAAQGCFSPIPPNNNLQVNTYVAHFTTPKVAVIAPLGGQPVAGQWTSDIPVTSSNNPQAIAPFGTIENFNDTTSGALLPGFFDVLNARMPAYWDYQWQHTLPCLDPSNPPYNPLPNPYNLTNAITLPTYNGAYITGAAPPARSFYCYLNSPLNPDFVPSHVNPQFVLDDDLPATVQITAFAPINAAASITNLRVFGMDLSNPANVAASSVAPDGSSAIFPYPKTSQGSSLPSGAYITTITTDPSGAPETTNAMEPIYIAHDDTSFQSAFGVATAIPKYVRTTSYRIGGSCGSRQIPTTVVTVGGNLLPLVTLPSLGVLAVGTSTQTINAGVYPTVVVPYNGQQQSQTVQAQCFTQTTKFTGAQSALVVNTGSNSVSLLMIGQYAYPTGTVPVGNTPVAAVLGPTGTKAYIANYGDGTISEVDLAAVTQTRTLGVMPHPTTLTFDSSGSLWVGGQGFVEQVSITNWNITSTIAIDGTISGMSFDTNQNSLVTTVLQNGTVQNRQTGSTKAQVIQFNRSVPSSYSTSANINLSTGAATYAALATDTTPFTQSALASYLAFPGQTAFSPPIYTSSATNGDIVAIANGTTFSVSVISTGSIIVSGSVPYPIRGVALTPSMLYFTMSESNSLVSLPLNLP